MLCPSNYVEVSSLSILISIIIKLYNYSIFYINSFALIGFHLFSTGANNASLVFLNLTSLTLFPVQPCSICIILLSGRDTRSFVKNYNWALWPAFSCKSKYFINNIIITWTTLCHSFHISLFIFKDFCWVEVRPIIARLFYT